MIKNIVLDVGGILFGDSKKNIENLEYIKTLKEKGYRLYLLTNITENSYNYISSSINIREIFDGGIYAYNEYSVKQNQDTYNLLIDKFGLNKEETIFFDDKEKNVNMANKIGIKSFLFTSIEDIKRCLSNEEILENIRTLSNKEKKEIDYNNLINIIKNMTANEIIELSNIIGYPVFTRLCMGKLQHKFVLLQDGAAAIIINNEGKILLQRRADKELWGLPGGCQELGETFKETIIREVKEETNFDVEEKDLILVDIVSGKTRRNKYPNGDEVINNTVLYCIKNYTGELKWNEESKEMKFFDLDNLPENQNDFDLIEVYKKMMKN